jgi:hypothetical protein
VGLKTYFAWNTYHVNRFTSRRIAELREMVGPLGFDSEKDVPVTCPSPIALARANPMRSSHARRASVSPSLSLGVRSHSVLGHGLAKCTQTAVQQSRRKRYAHESVTCAKRDALTQTRSSAAHVGEATRDGLTIRARIESREVASWMSIDFD